MDQVKISGETFLKISNHDQMRPFLMSIVSDSNHWMFISSNGGLTAGRKNSDYALFPYYTDDKITEGAENTGSKTLFWVEKEGTKHYWQPFSKRNKFQVTRNLYKNEYGDKLIFEETNHDLDLTFQYQWATSDRFGFVKTATLSNESATPSTITLLDGLENIMPYGVPENLQGIRSNLADAYKRNELEPASGLGIFALSAIIVDRAEPSEALKTNVVWSVGLESPTYLLSSSQLDDFRAGKSLEQEYDMKAERGAYFVSKTLTLAGKSQQKWALIADVYLDVTQVVNLSHSICNDANLLGQIQEDINIGTKRLVSLVASSDGLRRTADKKRNIRHYANTLFNIMRGGIVDHNYQIESSDFLPYLEKANAEVYDTFRNNLAELGPVFSYPQLLKVAHETENADFIRLATEYLPLKFSRRHGDPSRPWNRFSINTQNEDGSKVLDYEGNWRDIFQNWEALAHSFPVFLEGMIAKFFNASTFDGYNPYRVTKEGFDWETIEPDDPWSYIGYWGDHQIIYLLKFLETVENHFPGKLSSYFAREIFVYANVPYKIKSYDLILKNPKDTIDFDLSLDHSIRERRAQLGADGALLTDASGHIHHVTFIEKMLATALAKLSNLVPGGGIWLNTQRPEWNDANNALVGNGVSMVTLYYLRRFFTFFKGILTESEEYELSKEIIAFFNEIKETLASGEALLSSDLSDKDRKELLDRLGNAGSTYRDTIYQHSFSGDRAGLASDELHTFASHVLTYLDHAIEVNRRSDGMYHAYNLLTVHQEEASIGHLEEMLEGQVAVLSSGYLNSEQALEVLDAMKSSPLFRPDQYSYLLYPNKDLSGFLAKNSLSKEQISPSKLLQKLIDEGHDKIIKKDVKGQYHFHGDFRNADYLKAALDKLSHDPTYATLVAEERDRILNIYEALFNHKAFTGRSGTFFGYEGLGSIYWHMVSKLLLAVTEVCLRAYENRESAETQGRLLEHYYEILEGIGVNKPPQLYGAFPTDPYSHTPAGKGVQQPGMTGQVKEDILSRVAEMGVFVKNGQVEFDPYMLRSSEFITETVEFNYIKQDGQVTTITLPENSLVFTYCQVPVLYRLADQASVEVIYAGGQTKSFKKGGLDVETSRSLFYREGTIDQITVYLTKDQLK